jgi:hypothetical protein
VIGTQGHLAPLQAVHKQRLGLLVPALTLVLLEDDEDIVEVRTLFNIVRKIKL